MLDSESLPAKTDVYHADVLFQNSRGKELDDNGLTQVQLQTKHFTVVYVVVHSCLHQAPVSRRWIHRSSVPPMQAAMIDNVVILRLLHVASQPR